MRAETEAADAEEEAGLHIGPGGGDATDLCHGGHRPPDPHSARTCWTGSAASAADMEAEAIAAARAKRSAALPGVRISLSTPLVALDEVHLNKGVVPLPRLCRETVVVDTPRIPGNHVEDVEGEVLSNAVLSHVRHDVLQRRNSCSLSMSTPPLISSSTTPCASDRARGANEVRSG